MLALRLQSVFYFARNMSKLIPPKQETPAPVVKKQQTIEVVKDKLSRLHKSGPQLQVSKILIKNGLLTSKQIWRSYLLENQQRRSRKQPLSTCFKSLNQLKQTLRFMRLNGKINNGGYDTRKRLFKGWKINQERALKYVHPEVKAQLEEFKRKKNQL